MLHILSPALAWLWRLVAPRGHANPSIQDSKGAHMQTEGVGSYWAFCTGRRVDQANLLLRQIVQGADPGEPVLGELFGLEEGAAAGGARIGGNAGQVAIAQQPAGQGGESDHAHAVFAANRQGLGLDVALEALREAWQEKRMGSDEIWRFAKICRVANVMRPYLESLG
jgi:hypothetical protein